MGQGRKDSQPRKDNKQLRPPEVLKKGCGVGKSPGGPRLLGGWGGGGLSVPCFNKLAQEPIGGTFRCIEMQPLLQSDNIARVMM